MVNLLCYEIFQFNLSLISAINVLQLELFITCQMLLSSGNSLSTKRYAEAVSGQVM